MNHEQLKNNYAKILVCSDGSKYSEKAIRVACDLAKRYDSKLAIIHVVDKTLKSDIIAGSEYTKILRRYAKDTLQKAQKIANKEGMNPQIITKEGSIANEIIKFSKKDQTDLIVIGSKGLGAVLKFLIGSVSSKVANHSLCSVLIVK